MKILFLDLECTCITPIVNAWYDFEVINAGSIKTVIERFQPDRVDIFSFAVHNDLELGKFNQYCRPTLEKVLDVKIGTVPTIDREIINACCAQKSLSPSKTTFHDICDFWGKDLAFQLYIQERFKKNREEMEFIFLDDAVKNSFFQLFQPSIKAYTLNIDDLKLNDELLNTISFLNTPSLLAPSALKVRHG